MNADAKERNATSIFEAAQRKDGLYCQRCGVRAFGIRSGKHLVTWKTEQNKCILLCLICQKRNDDLLEIAESELPMSGKYAASSSSSSTHGSFYECRCRTGLRFRDLTSNYTPTVDVKPAEKPQVQAQPAEPSKEGAKPPEKTKEEEPLKCIPCLFNNGQIHSVVDLFCDDCDKNGCKMLVQMHSCDSEKGQYRCFKHAAETLEDEAFVGFDGDLL